MSLVITWLNVAGLGCHGAQVLQASFVRVVAMLAAARAAPVQALTFPFSSVMPALRQFAHAKHVGKIVTEMPLASQAPSGEQVSKHD